MKRVQLTRPFLRTFPTNQDNMNCEALHEAHNTENRSHADMVHLVDTPKADKDALQRELETVKLAHANRMEQDLKLINTLMTEKNALQYELEEEKHAHEDRVEQDLKLINTLKTCIKIMQEEADGKTTSYNRDLVDLKQQLNVMISEKSAHKHKAEQHLKLADTLRTETDTLRAEKDTLRAEKDTLRAEKDTLRTETDTLRNEMAQEITRIQEEADHKAMLYQTELEELRNQLNQLNAEKLSSCEQPENPEEQHGSPCEDQEPLPSALHDQEATENAVVSGKVVTNTTKQKSFWKRFRHFLGLRKPQKWKK
uniref:protein Hook homolog 3-like n=1 Tax=Monopterus albus TaxID=43700 RepID=UPI0009B34A3B|nr:protein Hook homolog 3-like [Monopterus albus]